VRAEGEKNGPEEQEDKNKNLYIFSLFYHGPEMLAQRPAAHTPAAKKKKPPTFDPSATLDICAAL